jgi:hypothetical protein
MEQRLATHNTTRLEAADVIDRSTKISFVDEPAPNTRLHFKRLRVTAEKAGDRNQRHIGSVHVCCCG